MVNPDSNSLTLVDTARESVIAEIPVGADPALADVTNDGALDLFVGAGDGTVSIYYNDGTLSEAAWPTTPDVSLSTGLNAAPALDDLNGQPWRRRLERRWRGRFGHRRALGQSALFPRG